MNLSSYHLSSVGTSLLSRGLNFAVAAKRIPTNEIICCDIVNKVTSKIECAQNLFSKLPSSFVVQNDHLKIFQNVKTRMALKNLLSNHNNVILFAYPLPEEDRRTIFFQQDVAPPHNSRIVTICLNANCGECWIRTNRPVRWSPGLLL